jgi:hypothetical protein
MKKQIGLMSASSNGSRKASKGHNLPVEKVHMPHIHAIAQLIGSSFVLHDANKELHLGKTAGETRGTKAVNLTISGIGHVTLVVVVVAK